VDVMDDGLNHLAIPSRQARGFHVLGHRVEFHGYCASCRQTQHDAPPRRG
jgi:Fe2+ or Zn2+ uptake regulation protein